MKIHFEYPLGFDVLIRRNAIVGTVRMASLDRYGHQRFYVQYADNAGAIREAWFEAQDLESAMVSAAGGSQRRKDSALPGVLKACDFCNTVHPVAQLRMIGNKWACPRCFKNLKRALGVTTCAP